MESGADNSSDYDTSTVIKGLEESQSKQKRTLWWKEENCPSLNKSMERRRNPAVNGVCDAACLDLGEDNVPRQTVTIFLQRIGNKPITYNNSSPPRNQALLSKRQVKYAADIIVTRDTEKLAIPRR